MCLLKYFYYYSWTKNNEYYKDINYEWNKLDKCNGVCETCYKYTEVLGQKDKICYRCFEYTFYD